MDIPSTKYRNDEVLAVDLFAGAGGFSLAAANVSIRVIACVEINAKACETYRLNFVEGKKTPPKVFNHDILELSPYRILEDLDLASERLDFLVGGPPCQGFSEHRIKGTGVDDPRNKLLLRYFDFVSTIKPKIFIVENVPGLLWKRHSDYLAQFLKLGDRYGYQILKPEKLNAKDYGVPQNRNRVFIVGLRRDCALKQGAWPPVKTHFDPKIGVPSWITASTVFEDPPEGVRTKLNNDLIYGKEIPRPEKDASNIHMNHTKEMIEVFSSTPLNGSRHDSNRILPCHSKNYSGHNDVYGRIKLDLPGPTMTTGCFNPSRGRFLHPWKNHGITIRHAARFQTFPDTFRFCGGITSQGMQVGNAVPIKLGAVLLRALRDGLIVNR